MNISDRLNEAEEKSILNIKENLDFNCSVTYCESEFQKLLILKCGHMICKECIYRIRINNYNGMNNYYKCPQCRNINTTEISLYDIKISYPCPNNDCNDIIKLDKLFNYKSFIFI